MTCSKPCSFHLRPNKRFGAIVSDRKAQDCAGLRRLLTGNEDMPQHPIDPDFRDRAKTLRCAMTDVERRLWSRLRAHRLNGLSIRRQVPIGSYVVDFSCPAARLIIELDGGGHTEPVQMCHDRARTAWLQARGYRVLRFWNGAVIDNLDGVCETILAEAEARIADHARALANNCDRQTMRPGFQGTINDK